MVKDNQVQVCDDDLHMLIDGTYNTAGDIDYELFHIALKSNYHGWNDVRELVFDTNYKTARDNNQRTTYKVHQSLLSNHGVDTDGDHDYILLLCKYNKCVKIRNVAI